VALAGAALLSAAVGFVVGLPALRVRDLCTAYAMGFDYRISLC
jgi:ABC-type branched-subunit amino acid transport system permease subunit